MSLSRRNRSGNVTEPRTFVNPPGSDQFGRILQLVGQSLEFDELALAHLGAIDLTVNAVEIADLVEVQVHADRDPARPTTHDRIDVVILLERSGMDREQASSVVVVGWGDRT